MKSCSECNAEFQPTNNRQLACVLCKTDREIRIKMERRHSNPALMKRQRDAVTKYRNNNRERVRANERAIYWDNPDKFRVKSNNYNKTHRLEKAAYIRQWRADNVEHMRAWERNRYHNNPEINRKKKERARQKRFGDIDIHLVYERDGAICRYCGNTNGPFHIDHMIPLSRGGLNTLENLTVACKTCNLRKHTLTAEEFKHAGVC